MKLFIFNALMVPQNRIIQIPRSRYQFTKIFAIATNLSECIQNVLSKRTLSLGATKYNPGEMQYHSGLGSLFLQLPMLFVFSTDKGWADLSDAQMCITYLINGICFHFQTISAYALMEAISPVTHR